MDVRFRPIADTEQNMERRERWKSITDRTFWLTYKYTDSGQAQHVLDLAN